MFVIQSYLRNRQAKIKAWEQARDKWVAGDEYGYRSRREYVSSHPYPVLHWQKVAGIALPVILGLVFIVGISAILFSGNNHDTKPKPKTSTSQTQKKTDYKVGDKVQVVYGTYKDSVGVIVKLGDGDSAIIKLTDSTWTKAMCNSDSSCSSDGGIDNGQLLGISDLKNLVPYKETK